MTSSFKTPKEIAKTVSDIAKIKESPKITNLLLLSFLAGCYIAFGALLAEVATAGMLTSGFPVGLEKFVFGAMFPLGLITVILTGAELFTGNVLYMTVGVLDEVSSLKGLTRNWILSWIFNFIGALFIAYVIAYLGGIMPADPAAPTYAITQKAVGVAQSKVDLSFTSALIKGIGCNWLVCLAVWLANSTDNVISKIAAIWIPIMAFVTIGFEHCIANMFFIPLGIFLQADGVNWINFIVNNLVPVTIGNIIGGALFVGCIYWYTYLKN